MQAGEARRDANGKGEAERPKVIVLETGVVGSLDYKIISAERADDLFQWLKDNKYTYSGDSLYNWRCRNTARVVNGVSRFVKHNVGPSGQYNFGWNRCRP